MTDIPMPADGEFRDGTGPLPPLPTSRSRDRIELHPPVTPIDDVLPHSGDPKVGALARWWTLLLNGSHDWGSVDVSLTRHGLTRYRLVVFPPGTDAVERRLLRAWRAWPTWGAMLWVASQIVVSAIGTSGVVFAVPTIALLAAGAVLFALVAELRSRVRTLSVVRIAGYADPASAAMFTELKSLRARLHRADTQRARGQSSPADHEAIWWQVYDRLGQIHPGAAEDLPSR